ncbi:hypothetical protein [Streptomyces sp. NPDC057682]|uniref:hypothetical protein n=1 Tax=Streptomyces sp. NPDC057682 TaxID=3346210 RepID=UPI0036CB5133
MGRVLRLQQPGARNRGGAAVPADGAPRHTDAADGPGQVHPRTPAGRGALLADERPAGPVLPPFHVAAPLPAAVLQRARRLEGLLGDPRDRSNPYGHHALAHGAGRRPFDGLGGLVESEILPVTKGGHFTGGEALAAALRPLLRRDPELGHALVTSTLAAVPGAPLPDRSVELARLLGPAALGAAAGTALRAAVRAVAQGERRTPGLSRWRASLARSFADLLACESLTAVALRSLSRPSGTGDAVLRAAAGCVVPALAAEILDEAVLTLGECGHGRDSAALRWCLRAADGTARVRDASGTAESRAQLLRALPSSAGPGGGRAAARPAGEYTGRTDDGTLPTDPVADLHGLLDAAAAERNGSGAADGPEAGRARAAGRLLAERRLLTGPERRVPGTGAAAAERYAQLLTACVVLAVRRDTARYGSSGFLASGGWTPLALARAVQRLGLPPVGPFDRAQAGVEAELDRRDRMGVDTDLHATRILW